MASRVVYHATHKSNVAEIEENGFTVSNEGTVNIYGRGVYFWELEEDAKAYGRNRFSNDYGIVRARLTIDKGENAVVWNSRYRFQSPDTISRNLVRRNIEIIVIPNHLIEDTTFGFARGDAYCFLVDLHN